MKNNKYNKQYIMINENPQCIIKVQDFICDSVREGRDETFIRNLFKLKLDYHYVLGRCELGNSGDIGIVKDDKVYKVISIKRIV